MKKYASKLARVVRNAGKEQGADLWAKTWADAIELADAAVEPGNVAWNGARSLKEAWKGYQEAGGEAATRASLKRLMAAAAWLAHRMEAKRMDTN